MRKLTCHEFINKSVIVHGNKYDYSLVNYRGSKIKVTIVCPNHGEFEQKPNNHLMNHGCVKCRPKRVDRNVVLDKFILKHGNKYDYRESNIYNCKDKINIICPDHGSFKQLISVHYRSGCPKCVKSYKLSSDKFIDKCNKVHNFKYNYDSTIFKTTGSKVNIICPNHGIFKQLASDHQNGRGCPKCSGNHNLHKEELLLIFDDLFESKYTYDLSNYKNGNSIIKALCTEHGSFDVRVVNHKKGSGCSKCSFCNSKGEDRISKILYDNNIKYNGQYRFDDCLSPKKAKMPFDFYIENLNICIEYDGIQHFEKRFKMTDEDLISLQERDRIKDRYCEENNIYLIRIPYTDFDKIEEIIKEKIIKNNEII
jgi:hypothetical protein